MNEFKIKINGNDYNVVINNVEENTIDVEVNGISYSVEMEKPLRSKKTAAKPAKPAVTRSVENTVSAPTVQVAKPSEVSGGAGGAVKSPLPGVILEVFVKVGDIVKTGQKILVLEAMKMENTINSDREGKVVEVKVQKSDSVLEGADLVIIG
ncbi:MAG: biotin/lipoyl-binding protein [Prevotellaceae bacterium]|jgi:biotin carboxyl carrier protein|nr:biotin/lipoyl-binding protein [Prevotellaceae bacterium]